MALATTPFAAQAHEGQHAHSQGAFDALSHALAHPFTGADHLAAMVAVGVWSAQALRPAWRAPLAFVALLMAGALAGFAGLHIPAVEPMIAASVLVLGLLVAAQQQVAWGWAAGLVGVFAFFHGAAHGAELADGAGAFGTSALAALAGMALGSAVLHLAGMGLGRAVLLRRRWLGTACGIATAGLGAVLLTRLA